MYDIDELIEPRKKGKAPRDPFAQRFDQVAKDHGNIWEYQALGQNSGYKTPDQLRKYNEKAKGYKAHIEYMSPDKYFEEIGRGFESNTPPERQHEVQKQIPENFTNQKLVDVAMKGSKFAMPWIEYKEGRFDGQEGRHRASMARELGVEQMPVVIIDKKQEYREPYFDNYEETQKPKIKKKNAFMYRDTDDEYFEEDLI